MPEVNLINAGTAYGKVYLIPNNGKAAKKINRKAFENSGVDAAINRAALFLHIIQQKGIVEAKRGASPGRVENSLNVHPSLRPPLLFPKVNGRVKVLVVQTSCKQRSRELPGLGFLVWK